MPKNIDVCCDGTNNQFSGYHTNVIRTYKVLVHDKNQAAFYGPGVGTMADPWEHTAIGRRWSMIKGLAYGSGFLKNIEDAYRYLMTEYEIGDHVYLFGFSRGAYTVRALAGLLHSVGLHRQGSENLIPYAIRTGGETTDRTLREGSCVVSSRLLWQFHVRFTSLAFGILLVRWDS